MAYGKYNYKYQKAVRKKFPNNELTDMNAGDASTQSNEGYTAELAMISWFARINYDFAGKYLLEANIRADASSRLRKVTVGDIFLLSRVHGASARKHLWKVQKTAGCPD